MFNPDLDPLDQANKIMLTVFVLGMCAGLALSMLVVHQVKP